MGPKITIDSATLVNKAFEVIEAKWLYGLPYSKIDAVIHPQSVVHSLVEFTDGSYKAQLGLPDMRLPIQYALTYPERMASPARTASPAEWGTLEFAPLPMAPTRVRRRPRGPRAGGNRADHHQRRRRGRGRGLLDGARRVPGIADTIARRSSGG